MKKIVLCTTSIQSKGNIKINVLNLAKISNKNNRSTHCKSSHRRCSVEKVLLKILQNPQKNIWGLATLSKRDSTKVFSNEYCENFKNTYFEEHLRTTASEITASWAETFYWPYWLKTRKSANTNISQRANTRSKSTVKTKK